MVRRSRMRMLATCAAAVILALAGCGKEPGIDEPAREGLAIDIAGLDYNVFITRPLNLKITPDRAYYSGPAAKPGRQLWAVFLQTCNEKGGTRIATDDFVVEDNQGNEFEPIDLPEDNEWAYSGKRLEKGDCIPDAGSVADLGPTKGSMLLFDFSLKTTENRPLELHISDFDPEKGKHDMKTIELDL